MCVKEFLGYVCGHCSIPTIKACPLSESSELYPLCQYPAERPIPTGSFCHPCLRVLWNKQVLAEEEKHRQQHLDGTCGCNTVFKGVAEEREKLKVQQEAQLGLSMNKDKGKGKEVEARDGWEPATTNAAYEYTKFRSGTHSANYSREPQASTSYLASQYRSSGPPSDSGKNGENAYQPSSGYPEGSPRRRYRYVSWDAHGQPIMADLGKVLSAPYSPEEEFSLFAHPWGPETYTNQGMVSVPHSSPKIPETPIRQIDGQCWGESQFTGTQMKWYPNFQAQVRVSHKATLSTADVTHPHQHPPRHTDRQPYYYPSTHHRSGYRKKSRNARAEGRDETPGNHERAEDGERKGDNAWPRVVSSGDGQRAVPDI
jgi:hypothetical protein